MSKALAAAVLAVALAGCGDEPKPPPPRAPPAPKVSTTTFVPRVTDGGKPVAARVLLFDKDGVAVRVGTLDVYEMRQGAAACAIAPDVVGSYDGFILARGLAEIPVGVDKCAPAPAIPYGVYTVWAWRGIEYELWKGTVDLSANRGRVELAIPLTRVWTPKGTLAADLHVHAQASDDSRVPNPQRVVAQLAAGIQVVALSDHNRNGDLEAEIAQLGVSDTIASIASNEVTTDTIHLGVYPVVVDTSLPRNGAWSFEELMPKTPDELIALAGSLPTTPIVQVNHPRFRVTALFDNTGWDGVSWPPPFKPAFDAVEVLAGYTAFNVEGDRRFDESVRDFYTLIDHGVLVAPLGNSDTHDLNWVLDGTARTYVYVDHPPATMDVFDLREFVDAIRMRRVVATTGPWLEVGARATKKVTSRVGPGETLRARGSVWLEIDLAQASFVKTERIRITIGGATGPELAQQIDVPKGATTFHWEGAIKVPAGDTWIGVTADGDTALPLELTGSYQRDRWQRPGVTPYAIAAPILVDVDGRNWKAPRRN